MQHLDPERLTLLALSEPAEVEDAELTAHLEQCVLCRSEVETLRRTVDLARETVDYRDEEPRAPEAVWTRISADLGLADASADSGPGPDAHERPSGRHHRPDGDVVGPEGAAPRLGRSRWGPVVALAAAVAVGVVGTLVAVRPWGSGTGTPAVASSTATLEPVAGGPGGVSGRAVVREGQDGPELDVSAAGLPLQQGYYEVWVFDGARNMVSVGVLGPGSAATLPLPPTLDLRTYHVIDISEERYDGDQTHSKASVLRGTLTG